MPRGFPDYGPADESQGRGEPAVDAVERDKVVEQVVWVVGREPPRDGGPGHPRSLAPGDPEFGLDVAAASVKDEWEVDVETPGPLDSLTIRSSMDRRDRTDVRAFEQIVLNAHDGVVRLVAATRLRVQHAHLPRPEPTVHATAGEDRHGRAARVEPDAARIEELHPPRRPEVEEPTRFQEEPALLREEERKPGQVDHLLIGLHLREVRADREIRRQRWRYAYLRIHAALRAEEARGGLSADAVVLGFHGAPEDVRVQLDITRPVQGAQVDDRPLLVEMIQPLGATVGLPQVFLVLPADEPPHVEPEPHVGPRVKPQGEQRNAEFRRPPGAISRYGHIPDPVPVFIQVVDARELGVPHGAVWIRGEQERAASVAVAVDQQLDVVVTREICISAKLAGAHARHV